MQLSSTLNGTRAHLAQHPTKMDKNCLRCSISVPFPRRQAPVERESLPKKKSAIRCQTPKVASWLKRCDDLQESRGSATRDCASSRPARWQRVGQRNQRRRRASTCAEVRTGVFWTTTPPPAHAGRSSRKISLLQRKVVRSFAARQNHQTALGKFLNILGQRRQNRRYFGRVFQRLLCSGNSASYWFTALCCSDGSLAVIQPLWRQPIAEGSSSRGNVRPSELLALRKKNFVPIARATSPMHVGRSWSHLPNLECLPRQGPAMGRSSWTSAGFNGSTSSCPG